MEWYYELNGATTGPVSEATLERYVSEGRLLDSTLVWREGLADWQRADTVFRRASSRSSSRPETRGTVQDPRDVHREQLAGFWIRWGANFFDGLAMMAVGLVLGVLMAVMGIGFRNFGTAEINILCFLLGIFLWPAFEASEWQATPGKRMLGLVVVGPQGERIDYGRALGRHFSKLLSFITLCIGYAMIGWTQYRQGLHDMIAGTYVMRRDRIA